MGWARWVMVVLALAPGMWMTFDAVHALRTGAFVTPRTGEYAGQYGPWRHVASAAGIDPRGTPMKFIMGAGGLLWLGACAAAAAGVAWWPVAMLVAAGASVWFLPVGTVVSIAVIVLGVLVLRGSGRAG